MQNKLYTVLTRPIILFKVPVEWLVIEIGFFIVCFLIFKLLIVGVVGLLGLHFFGYRQAKKDPNFMKVWTVWAKHIRSLKKRIYH